MKSPVIIELSEEHRLANHVPDDVWHLSREREVFIIDHETGEWVQVLDCRHLEVEP
jgi:hypothetical protein